MIRVVVESPFAPRTTPSTVVCPWEKTGYAGCFNISGGGHLYDQHRPCPRCATEIKRNEESTLHARYLAAALRDCVLRGETPYAGHGLLTLPGVLRDEVPEERALGIRAGFAWREVAHGTVFYTDLGWSEGMKRGKENALAIIKEQSAMRHYGKNMHRVEERTLGPDWDRK